MLESRQLRCFIAVARELHFGRASAELDIAQSALSKHIQALERSLGLRLINRGRRSTVTLTAGGQAFLADALVGVEQLVRAEASAHRAARGEIGRVSVSYVASAALCGLLPQVLDRFRRKYANVEIGLNAVETPRQISALSEGLVDVAFLRPRRGYPEGIAASIVHSEPMRIALSAGHPLCKKRIELRMLADQTFIIPEFDENTGFAEHLADMASSGGFEPKTVTYVRDFLTAITLAAGGYGIVPVPLCMLSIRLLNIVFKPIDDYAGTAELAVAYSQRRASTTAMHLVDCAVAANARDRRPGRLPGRDNSSPIPPKSIF